MKSVICFSRHEYKSVAQTNRVQYIAGAGEKRKYTVHSAPDEVKQHFPLLFLFFLSSN